MPRIPQNAGDRSKSSVYVTWSAVSVARTGRKLSEKDGSRHVTAAHRLVSRGENARGADATRRRGTTRHGLGIP